MIMVAQDYGNKTDALKLCAALGQNNYSEDIAAERALDRILSVIGISKTFVLMPCDDINNALAVSVKGIRYIMYDIEFMQSLDRGDDWNNLFVLAHEVGHHINGHSLDLILYATEAVKTKSLSQRRNQELQADEFAGFILGKLGATLNQATRSIKLIASDEDDTNSTHPSRLKRVASIESGYNKSMGTSEIINSERAISLRAEEYFYKVLLNRDLDGKNEGIANRNNKEAINDESQNIVIKSNPKPRSSRIIRNGADSGDNSEEESQFSIWDYSKTINIGSDDPNTYIKRGENKLDRGDYNGAIVEYSKAIELDPNYKSAYVKRGNAKVYLEDFNSAISDYSKAIEISPNDAALYFNRGVVKKKLGDYSGAIQDYTKAIGINPNYELAYYNRGLAKYSLGDHSGACRDAGKAKALGYNSSDFLKNVCQ